MGLLAKTRVALCRQKASQISRHDAFPSRVACLEDACDSHNPGGLGGPDRVQKLQELQGDKLRK